MLGSDIEDDPPPEADAYEAFNTCHKKKYIYIGPWLSVSLVVVLFVRLVSVELVTEKEISYTTFASKIKTHSCSTWIRLPCVRAIMVTKGRCTL